jgi:hypothetical protein
MAADTVDMAILGASSGRCCWKMALSWEKPGNRHQMQIPQWAERPSYPNLGHKTMNIMIDQIPWRVVRLRRAFFFGYKLNFNVDDLPISSDSHWIH